MDPNQAWRELASAVHEEQWEEASQIAEDLLSWLDRGGFPPRISGKNGFDRVVAKSTCNAIRVWEIA